MNKSLVLVSSLFVVVIMGLFFGPFSTQDSSRSSFGITGSSVLEEAATFDLILGGVSYTGTVDPVNQVLDLPDASPTALSEFFTIGDTLYFSDDSSRVSAGLVVGQTKSFLVGGDFFDVSLLTISNSTQGLHAVFVVNGISTSLTAGNAQAVNGVYLLLNSLDASSVEITLTEIVSSTISDVLSLGQTRTYFVDGFEYDVTFLAEGTDSQVRLLVNGETSPSLSEGDFAIVAGVLVTLRVVIPTSDLSVVEFSLTPVIREVMQLGQTRTLMINGEPYETSVLVVGSSGASTARLAVNGVLTPSLGVGELVSVAGVTVHMDDILLVNESLGDVDSSVVAFSMFPVVYDELPVGATKSIMVGADVFDVSVLSVEGELSRARFLINGVATYSISIGDVDSATGVTMQVHDIQVKDYLGEQLTVVDFSLTPFLAPRPSGLTYYSLDLAERRITFQSTLTQETITVPLDMREDGNAYFVFIHRGRTLWGKAFLNEQVPERIQLSSAYHPDNALFVGDVFHLGSSQLHLLSVNSASSTLSFRDSSGIITQSSFSAYSGPHYSFDLMLRGRVYAGALSNDYSHVIIDGARRVAQGDAFFIGDRILLGASEREFIGYGLDVASFAEVPIQNIHRVPFNHNIEDGSVKRIQVMSGDARYFGTLRLFDALQGLVSFNDVYRSELFRPGDALVLGGQVWLLTSIDVLAEQVVLTRLSDNVQITASYAVTSPGDTTPPTAVINSPASGSQFSAGTTTTGLSVTTNEPATCRFSTVDQSFDVMSGTMMSATDQLSHSATLSGLTDGSSYTYYVRCRDTAGNAMTSSASVSFSVATVPIQAFSATIIAPEASETFSPNTRSVDFIVQTSEAATCRWSTSAVHYSSMPSANQLSGVGTTSHSTVFDNLNRRSTYTRYASCINSRGDVSPLRGVTFTIR